jgi:hypothetical protein
MFLLQDWTLSPLMGNRRPSGLGLCWLGSDFRRGWLPRKLAGSAPERDEIGIKISIRKIALQLKRQSSHAVCPHGLSALKKPGVATVDGPFRRRRGRCGTVPSRFGGNRLMRGGNAISRLVKVHTPATARDTPLVTDKKRGKP